MAGEDERKLINITPRRLFTNRLISGLHELCVQVSFVGEDAETVAAVGWEIVSAAGEPVVKAPPGAPWPENSREDAVLIAATLPASWEHGMLKVTVETGAGAYQREIPIEGCCQGGPFHLPLRGEALVVVGHRIGELHRTARQIPSQQFGWDLLGLSDNGLSILSATPGRLLRAADFAGFGKEVIAPAAARVHAARDDVVDLDFIGQLPTNLAYFQEDLTRALGNYVVLEHAEGIWSVLAHLQQGSVAVAGGQRVAAGEFLARLGNSGFSSGPHLHFHFMDGPDILRASPLPVALTLEDGVFAPEAGNIIENPVTF
jgi:murein DD-endopeptidase MepM/ murein hydrolase activator NlpD